MSVAFAGTVTGAKTLPDVHDRVSGNPEIETEDETTQLLAPVTVAERVSAPPASEREEGEAWNDEMIGGGDDVAEAGGVSKSGPAMRRAAIEPSMNRLSHEPCATPAPYAPARLSRESSFHLALNPATVTAGRP